MYSKQGFYRHYRKHPTLQWRDVMMQSITMLCRGLLATLFIQKSWMSLAAKCQYVEKSLVFTVSDLMIWKSENQSRGFHPHRDTQNSSQRIHNPRPISPYLTQDQRHWTRLLLSDLHFRQSWQLETPILFSTSVICLGWTIFGAITHRNVHGLRPDLQPVHLTFNNTEIFLLG